MGSDRTALFPGTFDPFTNGHLDLTRRAARLFDRVVVAVAESPAKGALFPMAERVEMIRSTMRSLKKVEVVEFSDLVVDCARRVGAAVIIRGLRAVSDFEFEFQMALMNRKLSPALEVAFLMPSMQYTYLNSTLVKEVARLGGSVQGLVPGVVEERLRGRFGRPRPARAAAAGAARGGVKPEAEEEGVEAGEAAAADPRSTRDADGVGPGRRASSRRGAGRGAGRARDGDAPARRRKSRGTARGRARA